MQLHIILLSVYTVTSGQDHTRYGLFMPTLPSPRPTCHRQTPPSVSLTPNCNHHTPSCCFRNCQHCQQTRHYNHKHGDFITGVLTAAVVFVTSPYGLNKKNKRILSKKSNVYITIKNVRRPTRPITALQLTFYSSPAVSSNVTICPWYVISSQFEAQLNHRPPPPPRIRSQPWQYWYYGFPWNNPSQR